MQALSDAYNHCGMLLRDGSRDVWLACLFAPQGKRHHLHALYAFAHEIGKVRDLVSSPMPGEIRLQWWREVLEGIRPGEVASHPVAAALLASLDEFGLPRQALLSLVEAHIFDLYDDPMPDMASLEGYCGETCSILLRLACLILADGRDPGGADAAGHAGVAIGMTRLLCSLPRQIARGQMYLPKDILEQEDLTPADVLEGRKPEKLADVIRILCAKAKDHLEKAEGQLSSCDPVILPAFVALAGVPVSLKVLSRDHYRLAQAPVIVPQWRVQWAMWRWARRFHS